MNPYLHLTLLMLVASLAACSAVDGEKFAYRSQHKDDSPKLESPPDLTQLTRGSYPLHGGVVMANSYQTGLANTPSSPTALSNIGDVRIERSGALHWLVIDRPAGLLWEQLQDFWRDNGFLLAIDQRDTGIMETDWTENRAKLPQDIVRSTAGKLVDSTYSTGALDRFRTRLEHTPDGATEIYVSHRGMIEVHSDSTMHRAIWQPRPTDPELETELLRRLMVKLGASQMPPSALVVKAESPQSSRIAKLDDKSVVQLNDGFDRAWRRVGLTLDRTGFTVEDRDRNAGLYFVRYVTPNPDKEDPSIFSKLLSIGKADANHVPLRFRISVKSQGETSSVSVLDEAGVPDSTENARRIVQVIADDLS